MANIIRVFTTVALVSCGSAKQPAAISNTAATVASEPSCVAPEGGEALLVQNTAVGGVFELRGNRDSAHASGECLMQAQCGKGNYKIVQEGEEILESETGTATAWRVHFQCDRAASAD
ncbi:MAG: hypothetical protein AB7O24_11585 [Kofleriaceae bacterium]